MPINTIFETLSTHTAPWEIFSEMDKRFSFFEGLIREQFVGSFASVYDKIDEWTSMQTLIVVSTIDEHFDVLMSHNELKKVTSLEVLHEKVLQKTEN